MCVCGIYVGPDDYTDLTTVLTFTADDVIRDVRCVNVSINDDDILEGDQEFTLSLSSLDPVVFGTNQATVLIIDNDSECEGCNL